MCADCDCSVTGDCVFVMATARFECEERDLTCQLVNEHTMMVCVPHML